MWPILHRFGQFLTNTPSITTRHISTVIFSDLNVYLRSPFIKREAIRTTKNYARLCGIDVAGANLVEVAYVT